MMRWPGLLLDCITQKQCLYSQGGCTGSKHGDHSISPEGRQVHMSSSAASVLSLPVHQLPNKFLSLPTTPAVKVDGNYCQVFVLEGSGEGHAIRQLAGAESCTRDHLVQHQLQHRVQEVSVIGVKTHHNNTHLKVQALSAHTAILG